ncbi:MAG: hypothetical protein JXR97_09095 [Planctomycetes bacterium]|nr:hypothetical protein [Planctomycetota bacterium]
MSDYFSDLRRVEDEFIKKVAELQKEYNIGDITHQIVILSPAAIATCKEKGVKANSSIFGLIKTVLPYSEANETCINAGGRLAVIAEENLLAEISSKLLESDEYSSAWVADALGSSPATISGTKRIEHPDPIEARWFICEWLEA